MVAMVSPMAMVPVMMMIPYKRDRAFRIDGRQLSDWCGRCGEGKARYRDRCDGNTPEMHESLPSGVTEVLKTSQK